jgi:hypothetical protein
MHGYETWSLTLREEHRLGVFENRVLRRIFRPMRDEVTGEWKKKLHNEEFVPFVLLLLLLYYLYIIILYTIILLYEYYLYYSSSIIRIIKSRRRKWAGHVARMGEKRNACRLLVESQRERRPRSR